MSAIGVLIIFPLVAAIMGHGGIGRMLWFWSGSFFLVYVAATLVFVVLWGLVAHLVLVLTTPKRQRLRRTYQALCYSAGTSAVCGVPCVGFYLLPVAWIWWTVSAVLMFKQGHQVSWRRWPF